MGYHRQSTTVQRRNPCFAPNREFGQRRWRDGAWWFCCDLRGIAVGGEGLQELATRRAVSLIFYDLMRHHDACWYLAMSTERDQRGLD